MKYEILTKKLVHIVKELSFVDLFCMMGSVAAGTDQKESDIDFYVLLRDLNHKKEFIKKVNTILPPYGRRAHYFIYKKKRVSIHIHTTEEITVKVRHLFKDVPTFLENEWIARGYIFEAIPLYDPRGIFRKFQNKIGKYPTPLKKKIVRENLEELEWRVMMLHRGIRSAYQYYDFVNHILRVIYRIIYAQNERYYLAGSKRVHNDLLMLKPDIKKEMEYITIQPNTPRMMKKKVDFIEEIYKKLNKKYT